MILFPIITLGIIGNIIYINAIKNEINVNTTQMISQVEKNIDFHIKRYVKDNHIFKEIDFEDQGEKYHFTEKVKALTLQDFESMMEEAGIFLLDIFGDYKLKKYHKTESERLIMIFK